MLPGRREVVTNDRVRPLGKVFVDENVETDGVECFTGVLDIPHLGDTVSNLDTVGDLAVVGDCGIVPVCHAPFVDTELWLSREGGGEETM